MKIYKENNSQDARFQSRIISKQFQIKVDYERNCNKVIGGKLQNGMTETEIAKQEAIRHISFYIVQMYEVQMLGQEIIHKSFPHRLVFVKRRLSRASLVTKRWKLIFFTAKNDAKKMQGTYHQVLYSAFLFFKVRFINFSTTALFQLGCLLFCTCYKYEKNHVRDSRQIEPLNS